MNKSRIEIIKAKIERFRRWDEKDPFPFGYYNNNDFPEFIHDMETIIAKLEQAEKALEWYTDNDHYEMYEAMNVGWTNDVTFDGGAKAREALAAIRS